MQFKWSGKGLAVCFATVAYCHMSVEASTESRLRDKTPTMTVLVTGGAGFIGMHVCEELLRAGHTPIAYDNMNRYYDVRLKRARMNRLIELGIQMIVADVCDANILGSVLSNHSVDVVLHLAAQAGVRYSISHPLTYTQNNIDCFIVLLEQLSTRPIRVVYASSSSVYGTNRKIPFTETDAVEKPASVYAATKRANELLAHTYNSLYKIPSIGLRFFTVYGPWGRPDMAYWAFTKRITLNRTIRVFNHGKQTRDFTFIDDIVAGIVASLKLVHTDTYVVNLGNNRPVTLHAFVAAIESAVGRRARIKYVGNQPGDVPITYANITRAFNLLKYSPTTRINTGIQKFVRWYNEWNAKLSISGIKKSVA